MRQPWRQCLALLWPETGPTDYKIPTILPDMYQGSIYLFPYKNNLIQQLIKRNKYHGDRAAAQTLAAAIDSYVAKYLSEPVTIIPIPSSHQRWRERGYYHLENILKCCEYKLAVRTDILKKKINTAQQTRVTKAQRLQQQAGTFTCNTRDAQQLHGTIILFDDVVTTGATMAAARASLAPHLPPDAKLICLALAH